MRIKPTRACEITCIRIYYVVNVVTFLQVSVTFSNHVQGGFLLRIYCRDRRACSAYGGEEMHVQSFGGET